MVPVRAAVVAVGRETETVLCAGAWSNSDAPGSRGSGGSPWGVPILFPLDWDFEKTFLNLAVNFCLGINCPKGKNAEVLEV